MSSAAKPESLFELIDRTDDAGVYRFVYPSYLEQYLPASRQEMLRNIFERELEPAQFACARMLRGSSWIDQFEASASTNGAGQWEGRLNMARTLHMPGDDPRVDLQTLHTLFTAAKHYVAEAPNERRGLQITNERNRHGKVFGGCSCLRKHPDRDTMAQDTEATARFQGLVNDLALQPWLRDVALSLGRLGPHSWWWVGEEQLFPESERPFRQLAQGAREDWVPSAAAASTTAPAPRRNRP